MMNSDIKKKSFILDKISNKGSRTLASLIVLGNVIQFALQQTPTAQWNFDANTTSTYTDNLFNSGSPQFYIGKYQILKLIDDNGSNLGSSSSRYVTNGMYFEGENLACTHAPAGTTIRCQGIFSVDAWVYVNVLQSQSLFICRLFVCTFIIKVRRKMVPILQMNDSALDSTTMTRLNCYVQTDSGLTTTDNNIWFDTIDDDPSNGGYLCAGGTVAFGFSGASGGFNSPYTGMVNRISYYFGTEISSTQISTLYSTNCDGWCRICPEQGASPNPCLQSMAMMNYIQGYDFVQTEYPVSQIQFDSSTRQFNLDVNSNFARTPAYAHKTGLWFDTTFAGTNQYMDSISNTILPDEVNSFTIETWIRPTTTPTGSNGLFEKFSTGGSALWFGFQNANQIGFQLSGTTVNYNTGGVTLNQWHYLAVSVVKLDDTSSRVCIKYDSNGQSCNNVNKIFTETGTVTTRIGSGFNGYMNNLRVYDYAKENLDMNKMVQTSGCTANTNGNTCTRCPYETGQCINDCSYNQYVNDTTGGCTSCYESCRSCWDAYNNNCFSCPKTPTSTTWTYNYIDTCLTSCGDSVKDDFEECEDGNTANGDGCSSTCTIEDGYSCQGGSFTGKDTCYPLCGTGVPPTGGCDDGNFDSFDGCNSVCKVETGWTCSGVPSTCTVQCGDGRRVGSEECDDGNIANSDGCSSSCKIEVGYNCSGGNVINKDKCVEICGDGKDMGNYGCDDGNTANFDGCDKNCKVEIGWTCTGGTSTKKDTCTESCGDGRNFNSFANECDDGNTVSGDGCSSTCKVEAGFSCVAGSSYTKDQCFEICGDGLKKGYNQCDDGNTNNGDGCHSDCTVEIGYQCSGGTTTTPDTCSEICGDGKNFGTYACDDGNLANGDGCSSTCTVESYYTCTKGDAFVASKCTKICDGLRDSFDMCDDGNLVNGDGCDYCCHREIGFTCLGGSLTTADTCSETCGDGRRFNQLPCDDGNILSGDGCSSTCSIETGFTCQSGKINQPDECKEICGDGKNFGQYQCDDGNISSGDGCSSTCYIESGFTCTTGNATKPSVCKEICGDGKNMNSYVNVCDDGNVVSGDGCSNKCVVETGFTCSQGSYLTPDICEEICGDGLNMGQKQCDDGNIVDNDGCSQNCVIEKGYACTGGSKTKQDYCYSLSAPLIVSSEINKANTQITVTFNDTVLLAMGFNPSNPQDWSVEMHGPLGTNGYSYYWNVTRQGIYKNEMLGGTKSIIIDFLCENQLYGSGIERVVVNFNDRTTIRSIGSEASMINSSLIVFPYGQDDRTSVGTEETFPPIMDDLTEALILSSIGIGMIGSFFGYSMQDVWIMTQGLQQVYLVPMNYLFIPTTTTNFALNLKYAMPQSTLIGYLCFGGSTNYTSIEKSNPPAHYGFNKMGIESNALLYSSSDVLSIMIYCFAINGIIEVFRLAVVKREVLNTSLSRVQSSLSSGYIQFAFMKLAFGSHLNLKHINFDDAQNGISSLLSIFIAISCWLYMFYLSYRAITFFIHLQKLRDKYSKLTDEELRDKTYFEGNILFQDYNLNSFGYPATLIYPTLNLLKLLLVSCLVVSGETQNQLQGIMIVNLLQLTATLILMPYNLTILNLQQLFNDGCVLLIYLQAHQFIPKATVDTGSQAEMGKQMIVIMFLMVAINSAFVIFQKLTQIFKCKSIARPKVPQERFDLLQKASKSKVQKKQKVNQTSNLEKSKQTKNSDQLKGSETHRQLIPGEQQLPINSKDASTKNSEFPNKKQQQRKEDNQDSRSFSESNDDSDSYDSQENSRSYSSRTPSDSRSDLSYDSQSQESISIDQKSYDKNQRQ